MTIRVLIESVVGILTGVAYGMVINGCAMALEASKPSVAAPITSEPTESSTVTESAP